MLTPFVIFLLIKLILDQRKDDKFLDQYPTEDYEKHFFQN